MHHAGGLVYYAAKLKVDDNTPMGAGGQIKAMSHKKMMKDARCAAMMKAHPDMMMKKSS